MRMPTCDIYLRLSDARLEEALTGREAKCRAQAELWGWTVRRVVVENDVFPDGRVKPVAHGNGARSRRHQAKSLTVLSARYSVAS